MHVKSKNQYFQSEHFTQKNHFHQRQKSVQQNVHTLRDV